MILTTIDTEGYITKPEKNEIGKISRRIAASSYEVHNLKEFADLIGNKGYTWCPAVFKNQRKNDDFIQVQMIALDFDEGISFDDVLERSKRYMQPILFAYETFSSLNQNKFRIVFMLDKIINDIDEFNLIIDVFMRMFPECDKSCKDISRMFFGGKRLIYYNEKEYSIELNNLMMNFSLYLKDRYGMTHYKAHLKVFKNKHTKENSDGNFSPFTLYNKNTNGENLPKKHKCYRGITNKLYDKCRLYKEFTDDSEWLYYKELCGLAMNLIHAESGEKHFLKCIEESKYDSYKREWKFFMNYFKEYHYYPMRCEKFCPYCDECPHGNNMLCTAQVKRKEIIRLKEPEYVSIEDVQSSLRDYFYEAISSHDKKLHVIKAQTAIGKTHLYVNYLKTTEKPCIISVPTNILKHEVYEKCIEEGIEVMETPSIKDFEGSIPKNIDKHIQNLYSIGEHRKAQMYIKSIADKYDIPALKDYINQKNALDSFKGHIITTHHRILYSSQEWLSKYEIIIDEDIMSTISKNQYSVLVSDIEDLYTNSVPKEICSHLSNIISLSENNEFFSVKPMNVKSANVSANFNLKALLNAEHFYSDGEYVTFYQTPKLHDLKYIVLSATANEFIYNQFFGSDKVHFYNCPVAKYKGNLIQHFDHSYSRRYIEGNKDRVFDTIKETFSEAEIITFKKYDNHGCDIHFGNSEGCNSLKGRDICVVGTPHMKEFLYKLLAYQMGCDTHDILHYRETEHNGYKFWFHTYGDEVLRNIQFWMIESELEQSVGRARLLRCDCTVRLFSDFPLKQSELSKSIKS